MKFLTFLFFLSIHLLSYSSNTSDFQQRINQSSDAQKLKLYEQAIESNLKKNPEAAMVWSRKRLVLAQKVNSYYHTVEAYRNLALLFKSQGAYDSALVNNYKAEKLALLHHDEKMLADIYGNISANLIDNGEFEKGIGYVFKSIKLQEKFHNNRKIGRMYVNLGDVYIKFNKVKNAQFFIKKAIKIAEQEQDKSLLGAAKLTYGLSFTQTGDFDSALVYFEESARIREELKEYSELYWNYNTIGGVYYYLQDIDKALEYFKKALDMGRKMKSKSIECTALSNIGALYKDLKQYDQSLFHHQQALDIARQIKLSNVELDALENLIGTYSAMGDYKQAFILQESFQKKKEQFFSESSNKQLLELQTKYNVEKKNNKIKQQRSVIQKATTIRIGLIIIILLIVISGIALFLGLKSKQKQKIQALLFQEKQQSLKMMIDTEEKERARIAKDLHDGVAQDLTAIYHNVYRLVEQLSGENQEQANQLLAHIKQTSNEVRTISHQMMPIVLQEKGLIQALEELFNRSLTPVSIQHTFDVFGIDERLPQKIEISMYRIIQELINNIVKHSGATEVSCVLRKNAANLILIMDDNGSGMDASKQKTGLGLESLKSRLEFINGQIIVDSDERQSGFQTFIQVPLS
ncbi:MAG: sensor histidine kinase [Fluviicola sp.]|nr:sensor histidine kinase [Fluviicola sp.]